MAAPPAGAPPGPADSVPLSALLPPPPHREPAGKKENLAAKTPPPAVRARCFGVKTAIGLFAAFLFVVSDVFTNHVLSSIGGAVRGRAPTALGTVLQGICLVALAALVIYLERRGLV
jgi:hypothetical protein